MNLQDELNMLKERIAELEEQVKEEQEFPRVGDEYWYVDATGRILIVEWEGYGVEEDALEIGNVFKTKEQAEFAVEKLKVEAELRKFSKPFVDGKGNSHIKYRPKFNELNVSISFGYQDQGVIYFESTEKANEAIQSVGEHRIKKYIFGVEDQ